MPSVRPVPNSSTVVVARSTQVNAKPITFDDAVNLEPPRYHYRYNSMLCCAHLRTGGKPVTALKFHSLANVHHEHAIRLQYIHLLHYQYILHYILSDKHYQYILHYILSDKHCQYILHYILSDTRYQYVLHYVSQAKFYQYLCHCVLRPKYHQSE